MTKYITICIASFILSGLGLAQADAPTKESKGGGIPTILIEQPPVPKEPDCEIKQVERRSTYTPGFGVSLPGMVVPQCNCGSYIYMPGVHAMVPEYVGSHTIITYEEVCK